MSARAGANVLLVDDRPENLLALEAILAPLGQNLVKAESGEAALRALLHDDFAAILLDVQMPGFDGYETAELIKARERTRHVPIIFLTAVDPDDRAEQRGYGAGAVDYLFKPFDPVVLRSKVKVFIDLHHLKREAEELAHRALHDPLTGLPNRVLFRDRLELALAHTRRLPDSVGVFYIDLDGFKAVNDTFGHEHGDRLLIEVATRLSQVVRGADTVTRLGGDEFAIISDSVDVHRAVDIAERVLDAVQRPFVIDGSAVGIAASIGIALSDGPTGSDALTRAADQSMYEAKAAGGQRWALHDPGRGSGDLDLDVVLVPRINLIYDTPAGWGTEVRGADGAIVDVEGLDATSAARVIRLALERRTAPGTVAVPVARALLPVLAGAVRSALAGSAVPASDLCVEIPAGELSSPATSLLRGLEETSDLGVALAVRQAGSGGASPAALAGLPLGALVLDSDLDPAAVHAVVALAHALALHVVAVGVEDEEALELARERGCDIAQGAVACRQAV